MKNLMLILNPKSGKKKANPHIFAIINNFTKKGYIPTVFITQYSGHATEIVQKKCEDYDLIVCCGGDGTLNEVVQGLMYANVRIPVGYIPTGSTNDLAQSLKLPKNITKSVDFICDNEPRFYDVGCFNSNRHFCYVASFGAFTDTSYSTPQNMKNSLGHLAYILEAAKSLGNLSSYHLKIYTDETVIEDDFIFGAVMNSTSMGGIIKLNVPSIDFNDGLFEVILIKNPKNMIDFTNIINSLMTNNFKNDHVLLLSANKVEFDCEEEFNWSLDGEKQEGSDYVVIENIKDAVKLIY